MSDKVKYPKIENRKRENRKSQETEAKKYQDIVTSHPVEATSVTRSENYKNNKNKKDEETPEEKLAKAALELRLKNMVKKW